MKRYYVMTGVTSGLGLEMARALVARSREAVVLVGARHPDAADHLRRVVPNDQLWISELDTSSLASVRRFAAAVLDRLGGGMISGLALNAGVQIISGTVRSVDGYEMTFATNVLGHMALFGALKGALSADAVITSTASGTHIMTDETAGSYGFRGGFFPSAEAVAKGDVSDATKERQAGLDRYATSKLCAVLFTYGMARRLGADGPRFVAFDPGLMPGTGLARDYSGPMRLAWKLILPITARFMSGTSTAKRSGGVLADLLSQRRLPDGTGLHVDYTGKEIPSSDLSYKTDVQDALIDYVDGVI